ncbi:MAG: endonuclease/exonuclease/phosphatase family protein [Anaerohalosphaera sp.]|nr:endonuclease/exonuclease/phosphatase family protein [Anaerohalosphaera sp.]
MRRFHAIFVCVAVTIFLTGCANTNSQPLVVMTYNIHHAEGADGVLDIDRIAGVIAGANADIIALNEVDNNFSDRSDNQNQPKLLAEALNMHYVYGATITSGPQETPNQYGNAILSKYPIIRSDNHKLANADNKEPRCALAATIRIDSQTYTFIATHLNHQQAKLRNAQANSIIDILEGIDTPVILAGDFNCIPGTNAAAIMTETLDSSFEKAGIGDGGTVGRNSKIDYIFMSRDIAGKLISSTVIRDETTKIASDHLPMITLLER